MDRYAGGLHVQGRAELFEVDISDPLNDAGWQSLPIPGVHLAPGMSAAGPFPVSLREAASPLDGWSSRASWVSPDNGETWALAGEGPFRAA